MIEIGLIGCVALYKILVKSYSGHLMLIFYKSYTIMTATKFLNRFSAESWLVILSPARAATKKIVLCIECDK